MSIPNKAKGTIRTLKNYTKGFSDIQKKVREATSNDPVGPNGALMSEIARATFSHHLFLDVMEIMDKRLNDSGKNWRHVFKALTLMEYLLQNGSEEVVSHSKSILYVIKTLREFQYIDEQGKDQGMNVRHKAKDITSTLTNEDKLKELRSHIRDQMSSSYGFYGSEAGSTRGGYGTSGGYGDSSANGYGDNNSHSQFATGTYGRSYSAGANSEDRDLALAIEESRKLAQRQQHQADPDDDLRKAIELSKKEAELREQSIAKENEMILLDGYDPNPEPQNNKFNHIKQYDFFGNLVHDPNPAQSNAQADLLDLDPLHFTSKNNGLNMMSTEPIQLQNANFGQTNPFSQNNAGAFQNQRTATNNYSGLETSFNLHNNPAPNFQNTLPVQQPPPNSGSNFNSHFKDAFDGGFNAKLMPHQTQNNANAALASIARNSSQIDPFASLAAERSNSPIARPGSRTAYTNASNPFQGTWSNASPAFNPPPPVAASSNPPASLDIFNQPQPQQTQTQTSNPFASFQQQGTAPQSSGSKNGQQNIFF